MGNWPLQPPAALDAIKDALFRAQTQGMQIAVGMTAYEGACEACQSAIAGRRFRIEELLAQFEPSSGVPPLIPHADCWHASEGGVCRCYWLYERSAVGATEAEVDAALLCIKHGVRPLMQLSPDQVMEGEIRDRQRQRNPLPAEAQEAIDAAAKAVSTAMFGGGPDPTPKLLAVLALAAKMKKEKGGLWGRLLRKLRGE